MQELMGWTEDGRVFAAVALAAIVLVVSAGRLIKSAVVVVVIAVAVTAFYGVANTGEIASRLGSNVKRHITEFELRDVCVQWGGCSDDGPGDDGPGDDGPPDSGPPDDDPGDDDPGDDGPGESPDGESPDGDS